MQRKYVLEGMLIRGGHIDRLNTVLYTSTLQTYMYIGIVKVQKVCACQLDEIIITSSDVSACMALSSVQLTIIQAENFFSFVIHYVSFALWGIVVKKSKKILRFEEA